MFTVSKVFSLHMNVSILISTERAYNLTLYSIEREREKYSIWAPMCNVIL